MSANCPSCKKSLTSVNFAPIQSKQPFAGNVLRAIAHTCPHCSAILGVEVDPIAVKSDIVTEIKRLLGR